MKHLFIFAFLIFTSIQSLAGSCHAFYKTAPSFSIKYAKSEILELPSRRKMKSYFTKAKNLKPGDEIIVVLHGLGLAQFGHGIVGARDHPVALGFGNDDKDI